MSMQCYAVDAAPPTPERDEQTTEVRVKYKTEVRPGETVIIPTPDGIIMQPEALERIESCGRTIEHREARGERQNDWPQ